MFGIFRSDPVMDELKLMDIPLLCAPVLDGEFPSNW